MQIPLRTRSTAETYIEKREWRDAHLPSCPLHPLGGCSFARHGTYQRLPPRGLRIARWYCRDSHRTFSLLPDFLAARLPGLLASIEDSITVASSLKSMEAAADAVRGHDITLPGAVRWLRRRVRAVHAGLEAVGRMLPIGRLSPDTAWRIVHQQGRVLCELRQSLSSQILNCSPAPLGFLPTRWARRPRDGDQHSMWPDGPFATATVG